METWWLVETRLPKGGLSSGLPFSQPESKETALGHLTEQLVLANIMAQFDIKICEYEEGIKLATLPSVREYVAGEAVEIWLKRSGRIAVRAYNECGNNFTEIDLIDLLDWIGSIPTRIAQSDQ